MGRLPAYYACRGSRCGVEALRLGTPEPARSRRRIIPVSRGLGPDRRLASCPATPRDAAAGRPTERQSVAGMTTAGRPVGACCARRPRGARSPEIPEGVPRHPRHRARSRCAARLRCARDWHGSSSRAYLAANDRRASRSPGVRGRLRRTATSRRDHQASRMRRRSDRVVPEGRRRGAARTPARARASRQASTLAPAARRRARSAAAVSPAPRLLAFTATLATNLGDHEGLRPPVRRPA